MACIWACNSEWLISLTARRGQSLAGGRLTLPGFKGHVREHVVMVKTRGVVGWAVTLFQPMTAEKCLRPWPNLQLSGDCQSFESTLYLITLQQVQTNRFKWKSDLFSVFLLTLALSTNGAVTSFSSRISVSLLQSEQKFKWTSIKCSENGKKAF